MIISHKYKFLFVGLPFSASSAISKELNLQYEGKPFLRKHSLYHEFLKKASNKEKEYFVFAVLRHPMAIVVTIYEKMRKNSNGNFTNNKLFKENGGHITKLQREKFKFINNEKASFQEYFLKYYNKPYDNLASLTTDYCNYIIRYENIEKEYVLALESFGIKNPRPLPVANKTSGKKQNIEEYYTEEIKQRAIYVFGPFIRKYGYNFPSSWGSVNIPFTSILMFKIVSIMKRINIYYFKKNIHRKSMKGTIYGDMQHKKK